jgi:hypothetical protein
LGRPVWLSPIKLNKLIVLENAYDPTVGAPELIRLARFEYLPS